MAGWKIISDPSEDVKIEYTSFLEGRKFFAVDDSGSTAGSVILKEKAFVDDVHTTFPTTEDAVSLWGFNCETPTRDFNSFEWRGAHGGTNPTKILENGSALQTIKDSDVWFLLTDGQVSGNEVHRLALLAQDHDVLNVPLVFLIVGYRSSKPSQTNISVGISFFASAQNTLILFQEVSSKRTYVIAAKGCFSALNGAAEEQNLESWDELPVFNDTSAFFTHCKGLDIQVTKAECRTSFGRGVSLGAEWEAKHGANAKVDLELLLEADQLSDEDLDDILAEEAFNALAVACKIRQRTSGLRTLLQKQKVELLVAKLEDTAGAAAIISKMGDSTIGEAERKQLQEQLREAHAKNREHYHKSIDDIANSEEAQRDKKRNQLIDAALRALASIESAGFNAGILSRQSNRAKRAVVVDATAAIDTAKLDLEAPSYKGYCLVCCGEEGAMSICFKEPKEGHAEDNTTDFALNFPLAAGASANNVNLVSAQNICFQCALFSPSGNSIYQEPLTAVIPVVEYKDGNKKYINDQLYLALTARLATGAAGIAQLFMAMLQELLKTKEWAGAGLDEAHLTGDEDPDKVKTRKTFQWMLDQLIQNTRTREDFKETGAWVQFPQALEWTVRDFEANGLASFAVTYPITGFENLVALGRRTGAYSDDFLSRLKSAKTIYSVAAKYLAEMQSALKTRNIDGTGFNEDWKQKYLELIYQDFNGPLVPKDQGEASLLTDADTFTQRLTACIGSTQIPSPDDIAVWDDFRRKTQLVAFWLLFLHRGHSTAQTFFSRTRSSEPLASAVLSSTLAVPAPEHASTLLSIFARHAGQLINPVTAATHTNAVVPFASPFGASVLRCGIESCSEPFCTLTKPEDVTIAAVDALRAARTKHLVDIFGIKGRFESSTTGLPDRPEPGIPPTSIHTNLHISIAREWAAHDPAQRHAIFTQDTEREAFVARVRRSVCASGRGNLFTAALDDDIRDVLPSFFSVLAEAQRRGRGKGAEPADGIEAYEHDFKDNTLEYKVKWEMGWLD